MENETKRVDETRASSLDVKSTSGWHESFGKLNLRLPLKLSEKENNS